jgi:hypothetical protein
VPTGVPQPCPRNARWDSLGSNSVSIDIDRPRGAIYETYTRGVTKTGTEAQGAGEGGSVPEYA